MSQRTATSLEQEAHHVFELVDALDVDALGAMLTDDAQGIDEISGRWMRGRDALETYFAQLKDSVSEPRSRLSDLHAATWGDLGLVTCVLDQTYKINGTEESISAPTSLLFRYENDSWKLVLIHTVPIPD
jgi:ketosteroid isomerase-like protein